MRWYARIVYIKFYQNGKFMKDTFTGTQQRKTRADSSNGIRNGNAIHIGEVNTTGA
jgi:hypothetical protein